MLSRRSIRIKVMQTIYAHEHDREKTLQRLEKSMLENINSFYRAFLYNLYFICKTAEYAITDVQIRAGKFIPSEEDNLQSVRLFHNAVIQHLISIENLYHEIEKEKLNKGDDVDYFKQFFQELRKTTKFSNYSNSVNSLLPEDKEIVLFLYKNILFPNEKFQQRVEELFPTWLDDKDTIYYSITDVIVSLLPDQLAFIGKTKDQKEAKDFAINLLRKSIGFEKEIEALIIPQIEHWDKERLAILDLLLMKMALTEMLYFPEIPVKVSINEYIDLAKIYSTPKSGEFINGILDSIMRKLREEGKISKIGRGTIEN